MKHWSALSVLVSSAALGAPPNMNEYASGVLVETYSASPMVEMSLPDPVYQGAVRTDLRDLRVFNADGAPVPHAFCAAQEAAEAPVSHTSLAVFELKDAARGETSGPRIVVQTSEGTEVNVQESLSSSSSASGRVHIIDASAVDEPLRAIQFDWRSPDDASQASVRIEASEDLDRWRTVIAATTLLRAGEGEQALRRERIELPMRKYQYLRVQRADGGPPLILNGVVAERVETAPEIEPQWFSPNALPAEEANVLQFDAARVAPLRFARLRMPVDNSSLAVTLQSRPDDKSPWRDRWSGETYVVVTETERRESPPAQFEPTTDRYWRVLLPKDAAVQPSVEFGYRPARLRFLAQGAGPYTVAYGSRRAELTNPAPCDGLLADVSAEERRSMITEAYGGEFKSLGGTDALKPLPQKTPTRMIVLWSVLIVGVGLLVAMALSLLKRVKPTGTDA